MTLVERVARIIAELHAASPAILVTRATYEAAAGPIDQDYEDELHDECAEFSLNDAVRAFWNELETVDISWGVSPDGTGPGGRIFFPPLLQLVRPAFRGDEELNAMGPANAAERAMLSELHHLDLRDGGNWTAFRAREGEALELWFRHDCLGLRGGDIALRPDFQSYVETALAARGAHAWPLLLLDVDSVPASMRDGIRRYGLRQLQQSLEVLSTIEGAGEDAQTLLVRAESLRRSL